MGERDGIGLQSILHPRSRWSFLRNLWWKLFPPDLHSDALEESYLDLGSGSGLTYIKPEAPPPNNRIEEEIRRRLNGDGQ